MAFISDPHADAEAFEASLIAAGVIEREGSHLCEYALTKFGKKAEIVVGGDCLDKGPSNLMMLRSLAHLYRLKADITLLAGNHDLRLLMGLLSLERDTDAGSQHLFVRMGKKVIPLFKEVFDQYLADTQWDKGLPSEQACRQALFPGNDWFENFPFYAAGFLTPEGIEREISKMTTKAQSFEAHCAKNGLSLTQVYAAAMKCRSLFLNKSGEFSWFFRRMQLVKKRGSFLFLHAGLDDHMAELLAKYGVKHVNRAFKKNLMHQNLFSFYYGWPIPLEPNTVKPISPLRLAAPILPGGQAFRCWFTAISTNTLASGSRSKTGLSISKPISPWTLTRVKMRGSMATV